jgi:hypothetical protein
MRPLLLACLLPCLLCPTPLAFGQDGDPEAEHEKAVEKAQTLVDKALRGVARYAKRPSAGGLDPEQAVERAIDRLGGPIEPPVEEPSSLEPGEAYGLLEAVRNSLLERLRRLAPDRHPVPPEPKRAPFRLKLYDAQALLDAVEDHKGPNVGLGTGLDASGVRDDLDVEETEGSYLDPEQLETIVVNAIGEEFWDDPASIEIGRGRLIVNQTPQVHARIAALLAELGRSHGALVELELRVYRMPARLFQALGPAVTSLSDAQEKRLRDAVAQKELTLLAAHRVVAQNGQRVHVRRGSSRSIIAAIGVDQTGTVPVIHPVVNSLNLGQVLEVRPTVDRATQQVLLDVALSICELAEPMNSMSIDGNDLDLPRLKIARTSSTSIVPLGRGALLGGMFSQGADGDTLSTVVYVRAHLISGR